jgi:hypothetical protein
MDEPNPSKLQNKAALTTKTQRQREKEKKEDSILSPPVP